MDTLQLLGSAMGLGFLAGIRLYATVFGAGLAIYLGWFDPPPALESLRVLADWRVLTVSGVALAMEFIADKIPWVDTAWDAAHTFIRPIGAVALSLAAFSGAADAGLLTLLALISGGVAFTGHSTKAATRFAANHSPEPFSNWFLSLIEDILTPFGLWLVLTYPLVALAIVAVFLAIFIWIARKIYMLFRRRVSGVTRTHTA